MVSGALGVEPDYIHEFTGDLEAREWLDGRDVCVILAPKCLSPVLIRFADDVIDELSGVVVDAWRKTAFWWHGTGLDNAMSAFPDVLTREKEHEYVWAGSYRCEPELEEDEDDY